VKRAHYILTGILSGVLAAVPLLAEAQNACLQRNRVVSWRPVNETTIVYTDRQMDQWTVTLRDSCRNLTTPNATLVYRNWSSLSCLSRGDYFRVGSAGRGMSTCRVNTVQAGGPGAQTAGARR
jgi:hypothetical protein